MTKPASGTALDTGNSLYANLTHAWAFLEGSGTTTADSKGGNTATFTSSPAPTWGSDAEGPKILIGADGAWLNISTVTLALSTSYSIAFSVKKTTPNNNAGIFLGDPIGNSCYLWLTSAANNLSVNLFNADVDFNPLSPDSGTRADYLLVASWNGSSYDMFLYQNGTSITQHTSITTGGPATIKAIGSGFVAGFNFNLIGEMEYVYIWQGRALSSGDATTLATVPYSIFLAAGPAAGMVSTSSVTQTTLTVSTTVATGGTGPYNYQFKRAPDVSGSPGSFANIGPNSTATSFGDTGLSPNTKYWYEVVVTDAASATATSSSISQTTLSASFTVTPSVILSNQSNNITLTLVGTATTWSNGSTITIQNSVTGTTAVTAGTWTRTSNTSATLAITTGSGTGTFTITIDGVVSPTTNQTSAATNKASGNWSAAGQTTWNQAGVPGNGNTVTYSHNLTVDVDTIIGTSGITGTAAVTSDTAGITLSIAPGKTFRVRGEPTLNTPSTNDISTLSLGAGASLILDPPSGQQYKITGNNQFVVNCLGSSGSRCTVKTDLSRGGTRGYCTPNGSFRSGGFLTCSNTDFIDFGTATNPGVTLTIKNNLLGSSSFTDCNLLRSNYDIIVAADAGGAWAGDYTFARNKFIDSIAFTFFDIARNCVGFSLGDATASGTYLIETNTFDLTPGIAWGLGNQIFYVGNVSLFFPQFVGSGGWTSDSNFSTNFIQKADDVSLVFGPVKDIYILCTTSTNPHYIGTDASVVTMTYTGIIFESTGTGGVGDCIFPGANGTTLVTKCIVVPDASGKSSGDLVSNHQGPHNAVTVIHNTYFGPGEAGLIGIDEANQSSAGVIRSCQSNIIYGHTASASVVAVMSFSPSTTAVDAVTIAGHNGFFNPTTGTCFYNTSTSQSGVLGYDGIKISLNSPYPNSQIGAGDFVGNPQFVNPALPGLAAWGGTVAGGGVATIDGAIATLLANPALIGQADTGLFAWLLSQYAPTNTAYHNTGHDGRDVGAVPFIAIATSYTVSGPFSGTVNVVSDNFTIHVVGGNANTSITLHTTGSGSFSTSPIVYSGTSMDQTFTYTPTSIVSNSHILSWTASPPLGTDPDSISYIINPSSIVIIMTLPVASETQVAIPPTIVLGTVIATLPTAFESQNAPVPLFQQFTGTIHWATGYTIDGPLNGIIHQDSSTFKIRCTPDTAFPQQNTIVALHDGRSNGSFNPSSVLLTPSINEATFTYRSTRVGVIPIESFNNYTLVDPSVFNYNSLQGEPMADKFLGGVKAGSQGISIVVTLINNITFQEMTSIIAGSIVASYVQLGDTINNFNCVALSAIDSPWQSGGWFEIGKGRYRLDVPNNAFLPGFGVVNISVSCSGSLTDSHQLLIVNQNNADIYNYVTAGVNLRSTGFDNIPITPPATVAQNFREMSIQLYRFLFGPKFVTTHNVKTFADDQTTEITSQPITTTAQGTKYGKAE